MNALKTICTLCLLAAFPLVSVAQDVPHSALEGFFFQSAKFYVVVAVVLLILVGMFAYLFALDRRLRRLEEESA